MAQITKPNPALLLFAVMYSSKEALDKTFKELTKKFGRIKTQSKDFDFTKFSKYYEPEMGNKLMKRYIVFEKPFDRAKIVDIRLWTQGFENKLSKNKKRTVNIDPGYMTKDALVLATLKEKGHKIYLGKGVFADLQALFGKDEMRVFDYTFADIKDNAGFFLGVRKAL